MNRSSLFRTMTGLLLLLSFLYFSCSDNESKKTKVAEGTAASKGNAENGAYLVTIAGCLDCHSDRQFEFFSGPIQKGSEGKGGTKFHPGLFPLPGTLYAKNITSDTATGIGNWTDDEVIRAITQGISRNGDSLFPLMPFDNFAKLAKQDILDIVAYIRTLPPIENKVPARELMGPISAFYAAVPNTLDQNKKPDPADKVAYGGYLVTMASCGHCHTPMDEKGNFGEPLSGGFTFTMPAFTVNSANLTPDSATGIGTWTAEVFLNKFKTYRESANYIFDPKGQNTYMPWTEFAKLNDDDLLAIYGYLRSLKPVSNKVEKHPLLAKKS